MNLPITSDHPVYKYLNAIRNDKKRQYGFAYLAHLRHPWTAEPESECSYMAAQAVRHQINVLLNQSGNAASELLIIILAALAIAAVALATVAWPALVLLGTLAEMLRF
jgi:hypothetical protein